MLRLIDQFQERTGVVRGQRERPACAGQLKYRPKSDLKSDLDVRRRNNSDCGGSPTEPLRLNPKQEFFGQCLKWWLTRIRYYEAKEDHCKKCY